MMKETGKIPYKVWVAGNGNIILISCLLRDKNGDYVGSHAVMKFINGDTEELNIDCNLLDKSIEGAAKELDMFFENLCKRLSIEEKDIKTYVFPKHYSAEDAIEKIIKEEGIRVTSESDSIYTIN